MTTAGKPIVFRATYRVNWAFAIFSDRDSSECSISHDYEGFPMNSNCTSYEFNALECINLKWKIDLRFSVPYYFCRSKFLTRTRVQLFSTKSYLSIAALAPPNAYKDSFTVVIPKYCRGTIIEASRVHSSRSGLYNSTDLDSIKPPATQKFSFSRLTAYESRAKFISWMTFHVLASMSKLK